MEIISEIYNTILYFLGLTLKPEVFWAVAPLFIATIIITTYFEKYKDERQGWSTYLTNSLVILFVSVNLFRYIYSLGIYGIGNFVEHSDKSIAAVFLLLLGFILLRFNFEHILPEKIARAVSSTLTVHLLAYVVILFVYSNVDMTWIVFVSLISIVVLLVALVSALRFPLNRIFVYSEELKKKEKIEDLKEARYQIKQLKEQLRERKKALNSVELKKLDKQKKEAIKLKKIIKK